MWENYFYLNLNALLVRIRPKSVKYRFTKLGPLTGRDPREGPTNNQFEFTLYISKASFNKKPRRILKQRNTARMS